MRSSASTKAVAAALFISASSLFIPFPAPLRIAAGLLLSYLLPGLVFLLLVGERRPGGLHRLVIAPLLSPIVLALLVLAAYPATGSVDSSITVSVLVLCCLLALAMIRRTAEDPPADSSAAVAAPLSLVFGGLVVACYVLNHYLIIRSDAWYHASVVSEILDRGIPPFEPQLPDVPIRYMWIYHLFIAATRRLTGLGVFAALGAFNVVSALVFPWLAARVVSFFARDRRSVFFTTLLVIAGLESAAWILWPAGLARAFIGETRGWDILAGLLRGIDLHSHRVVYFLSPFEGMDPIGNWMVNLVDKFLTITAFSFALNAFLLSFITALSTKFRDRASPSAVILLFVLALETLLFHVIVGTALIAALVGSGIVLALHQRLRLRDRPSAAHSIAFPLAAAAAAACGFPYILSLMGGSPEGGSAVGSIHIGVRSIVTIAAPLFVLYCPAKRALRGVFRAASEHSRIAAAWILTLAALSAFVNLPTRNESKLIFPLFLLLSPVVAREVVEMIRAAAGMRRAALIAWTAVLFAVPPVLTVRGFLLDRPVNPFEVRRSRPTAADREVFAWIEGNTPVDAVVMENANNYNKMMPIHAHRRNFYPTPAAIAVLGYGGEKIERYRETRDRLFGGEGPAPVDIEALREMGVPVLVVVWRRDVEAQPALAGRFDAFPEWFRPVFGNGAALVYAVTEE